VHTEDLVVHKGSKGEAIEHVVERLPNPDVVGSLALVIKSVDAVDGGTFVIPTEEEEVLRILYLVSYEEADCLQTLRAAINIVTEEEIVGLRREATVLENTQQV